MVETHRIIKLPKILDARGNLTFIEELKHIPFKIARVYWIYDVPGGEIRGSHAFRSQHEIIVALSGSFDVVVNDGSSKHIYSLNRSYSGLYLPPLTWRTLENFSTNAVCLVLSSGKYNESEYIRSYDEFRMLSQNSSKETNICLSDLTGPNDLVPIKNSVYDISIIDIKKISSTNGSISVVEGVQNLPYSIKRVYYLYDIPAASERGAHAHRFCRRFLVALSGAFEVSIDDGLNRRTVRLERPFYGLFVPPGLWTSIQSFSSGSICLSIASDFYNEADYIRDYDDYKTYIAK